MPVNTTHTPTTALLTTIAPAATAMLGNATQAVANGLDLEDAPYDTNLHIAAIFILFAASLTGAMISILSNYVACLRRNAGALEALQSFGFGVVVATAFIHMIPPAIEALSNKALELEYEGLAMVIVLGTVFAMQYLETELVVLMSQTNKSNEDDVPAILEESKRQHLESARDNFHGHGHGHGHIPRLSAADAHRKQVTVVMFEVGVALHSVIIGVEIGVASGPTFTTLLMAICFHQFFEGVAVGASAVSAFGNFRATIGTAFLYACATPTGAFIGFLISGSYDEDSITALWVRGVLDAVAGGILIYAGIVELITYQYTTNVDFHQKTRARRHVNYAALYSGAAVMAVIGLWA